MRAACLLLVALAGVLLGPVLLWGDEKEEAFAKLQGDWVAEKVLAAGQAVPPEKFPFEFRFAEGKLTFKGIAVGGVTGRDRVHDLVLDAAAQPAAMDLTRTVRDQKLTVYAIYKLEGDRLQICFLRDAKGPEGRPAKFESSAAVPTDLLTLKRKPPM